MNMQSESTVVYRERLFPSPAVWFLGIIFGAVFGVIVVPLSIWGAVFTSLAGMLLAGVALFLTAAEIKVDKDYVYAANAQIPRDALGQAEPVSAKKAQKLMSTEFSPLAFHLTRAWIKEAVKVDVIDEADPTPYLYLSSRKPEKLATAINQR